MILYESKLHLLITALKSIFHRGSADITNGLANLLGEISAVSFLKSVIISKKVSKYRDVLIIIVCIKMKNYM